MYSIQIICFRPLKVTASIPINSTFKRANVFHHCVTYKIKTSLNLLKAYLRSSEVLELEVMETFENLVIGSAFVNNMKLVENSNRNNILSLINYAGEKIGEVKIHSYFLIPRSLQKCINIVRKDPLKDSCKCSYKNIVKNLSEITNNDKDDSELNYFKVKPIAKFFKISDQFEQEETINFKPNAVLIGKTLKSLSHFNTFVTEGNNIKRYTENPTILVQDHIKTVNKNMGEKFKIENQNSTLLPMKCNSKKKKFQYVNKKSSTEKIENRKTSKLPETNFLNHLSSHIHLPELNLADLKSTNNIKHSIRSKIPNEKVLNYLLGKHLDKEEEAYALNQIRKMSPCHDFVESINDLCSEKNFVSPSEEEKNCSGSVNNFLQFKSEKLHIFKFNFNNPIERKYYKKFLQPPSHGFKGD